MMKRLMRRLASDSRGAVAPTVALSLVALLATGGIAFDYARLATMDSELQNAADQAALAGASQLDGQSGSLSRAAAAARSLLANQTLLGNDTCGVAVETGITSSACGASTGGSAERIFFYTSKANAETDTSPLAASAAVAADDLTYKFIKVAVIGRQAKYALTPIVGALSSGTVGAEAVAGLGSAICKVPPVMLCNPDEAIGNTDETLKFNATPGFGLRLVTGDATVPGNFGWLEAGLGNGTQALAGALGYNVPGGDCQAITGVTTKTGMDTAVLNAFNTRFDVYANGNTTCPAQGGGICSPSRNTRKDLVCKPNNANNACANNATWDEASSPYHPTSTSPLPITGGATDPSIMGYPKDLCQAVDRKTVLASSCSIKGTGTWDRDAYFRVNYGWTTQAQWTAGTSLPTTASRYDVYKWELANPLVTIASKTKGIDSPQLISGTEAGFGYPATGTAGVTASPTQPDRRRISAAVLNCRALNLRGKSTNVPVPEWIELFLVEPAINRADKGGGKLYTDQKDIYVEIIGETKMGAGQTAGQVVRRDTPFLVK